MRKNKHLQFHFRRLEQHTSTAQGPVPELTALLGRVPHVLFLTWLIRSNSLYHKFLRKATSKHVFLKALTAHAKAASSAFATLKQAECRNTDQGLSAKDENARRVNETSIEKSTELVRMVRSEEARNSHNSESGQRNLSRSNTVKTIEECRGIIHYTNCYENEAMATHFDTNTRVCAASVHIMGTSASRAPDRPRQRKRFLSFEPSKSITTLYENAHGLFRADFECFCEAMRIRLPTGTAVFKEKLVDERLSDLRWCYLNCYDSPRNCQGTTTYRGLIVCHRQKGYMSEASSITSFPGGGGGACSLPSTLLEAAQCEI